LAYAAGMRISVDQFFLDRQAGIGLQAQLREKIAEAILSRRFSPGQRMPSSRRLAEHLGIARITASLVYQDLVADGYLNAAARSGYFVAPDAPGLLASSRDIPAEAGDTVDWDNWIKTRVGTMRLLRKPMDWRAYPYPFIYGQLDSDLFPHDGWRDCARRAWGKREFDQVAGDFRNSDDQRLVDYILSHSLPSRGILVKPENVLVTLGAQNGIWLAIQLLASARPGLRAVIEEPGYPDLREALLLAGCEVIPVPVDDQGLPPELIPEDVDLVCVSPSHQCPTGATLPMARRRRLLQLAEERDFLILEDDYDFEMSFLRPTKPALASEAHNGRVIHVGSFSKSLFPGLRLGYMAASARFIEEARCIRTLAIRHPPGSTQRTTAHFLALGHYNAHVQRLRQAFKTRRMVMAEALSSARINSLGVSEFGGAAFWVEGPKDLDATRLAEDVKEEGVLIEPGESFFTRAEAPKNFFRMAYSSIPSERIAEGVARVARHLGS
jgi:GntR family transcriptional regulator/MocR family aminotransferase